jgi:4,5-dihydroxyphthalate decarboxylase
LKILPTREWGFFDGISTPTPMDESKGVTITLIPEGKSLVQMLADGELDILCHENAHRMLLQYQNLKRVFPNFKEAEASYFKETGFFPINHVLVIKKEIVDKNPWVVPNLMSAFEKAKQMALDTLDGDNSLLSSPWIAPLLEEQSRLLKRDMFPYGLEANRKELETHIGYLHDQGLISRILGLDEIFAPEKF